MRLQPNIGSDRSWVWKVAADVSEGVATAETLAIRFANSDSVFASPLMLERRISYIKSIRCIDAGQFKVAFEAAQRTNAELAASHAPAVQPIPDAVKVTNESEATPQPTSDEAPTQDTKAKPEETIPESGAETKVAEEPVGSEAKDEVVGTSEVTPEGAGAEPPAAKDE